MIKLTPQVRSLKMNDGSFALPAQWRVHLPCHYKIARAALKRMNEIETDETAPDILIKVALMKNGEAYRLEITPKGILIACSTDQAAFWAVTTLSQIIAQCGSTALACIEIEDAPSLAIRGYMLDISRDKIPLKADLLRLIDLLSALKYNHLELYVEGFSFFYPSFASLYGTGATPLRPEEYLEIEKYCAQRGIDCVPSHNTFGHMTAWLAKPAFHNLANSPEGMMMWGMMRPASTINPLDPKSVELVKTYTADVLKISSSDYFNLNMDEPYELGSGKTAQKVAEIGGAQVFLDYFHQLYDHVKSYHKTPMIWGDFLLHHPEAISQLPKDTIFIDWGYDMDYPFMDHAEALAKQGVRFMLAPGTCSWNSITGRTQDMLETIHQAAHAAARYQGLGVLVTDWGDNGHVQPATISLPGIVYGGIEMWAAPSGAYLQMVDYLNEVVFEDQ
ncbi:MAG: family 20 glycosylhydrolase, partial [Firmicutes bacterium]|nr:family 20 glycosylhydrolase [Bacillota bacterium]